jgi:hypothetical protein
MHAAELHVSTISLTGRDVAVATLLSFFISTILLFLRSSIRRLCTFKGQPFRPCQSVVQRPCHLYHTFHTYRFCYNQCGPFCIIQSPMPIFSLNNQPPFSEYPISQYDRIIRRHIGLACISYVFFAFHPCF